MGEKMGNLPPGGDFTHFWQFIRSCGPNNNDSMIGDQDYSITNISYSWFNPRLVSVARDRHGIGNETLICSSSQV